MNNISDMLFKIIRILTYVRSISNTENVLAVHLIQMPLFFQYGVSF